MNLLQKFRALPVKEMQFIAEALLLLFFARILLFAMPFRICIKTVKTVHSSDHPDMDKLTILKRAMDRAYPLVFRKDGCLAQSLAARWMLQRRGIPSVLYFGVKRDSHGKFVAHAWLTADDLEIVPRNGDYTVLTAFK